MPHSKTVLRLALAAVAVPGALIGVAAPAASAAEITPVAEYADGTVSDTEAEVGAVIDDLGLEAE